MSTSAYIFAGIGLFLLVCVIAGYNAIIGAGNRVKRSWADVLTYERNKLKVLEPLSAMLKEYKDFESTVLANITSLREHIASLPNTADGNALKNVERLSSELVSGLRLAVEAYPQLQAGALYQSVMREISEQQENVSAAIAIFNMNVESHNNLIQMFPTNMINTALNKRTAVNPFTDSAASAGIEYKPNL